MCPSFLCVLSSSPLDRRQEGRRGEHRGDCLYEATWWWRVQTRFRARVFGLLVFTTSLVKRQTALSLFGSCTSKQSQEV